MGHNDNANKIQRIIRLYFENLYSRKLECLDEMSKFLDAYNAPKLKQEAINHPNRLITSNEIERIKKSLLTKKCPGPDGFAVEFY
jgi:hypothetical protein